MKENGIEVMLCKAADKLPEGDKWLYEIKYDGYRIVLTASGGKIGLQTRNGLDYASKFGDFAERAAEWVGDREMILDGELILTDERGVSDFAALQSRAGENAKRVSYAVFDILSLDGKDLRGLPLTERKKILGEVTANAPSFITESKYSIGRGKECLAAARKAGFEGIVAKRADSRYRGGRSDDWLKIKFFRDGEFVIGGYSRTDKKSEGVSALLLGAYDSHRKLEYVGKVGTGIDGKEQKKLGELFTEYAAEISPFCSEPAPNGSEKIFWLEPRLVAHVRFGEWTQDAKLRSASYCGLREDIDPREVTSDSEECPPQGEDSLKHPDKLIFPDVGVTKGDVYRYYESVADKMLGFVGGRVLSVVRCHGSVEKETYFNRHPSPYSKARHITVKSSDGNSREYFYVQTAEELLSEVKQGAIEFHVWGSRVESLERPDNMVLDLDPDEGLELSVLREGVREVKKLIDSLGLDSNLKTSGGKGYHITVPISADLGWEKFREFARCCAAVLVRTRPDLFTDNVRKINRKGKIYVDWARNTRGSTAVAPYSLRARPGAKIAAPIDWRDLDTVAPDGVDILNCSYFFEKK